MAKTITINEDKDKGGTKIIRKTTEISKDKIINVLNT